MKPGNIPRELRDLAQWVVWRTEVRDEKPTKVPYSVKGSHARANDPKTWATFEEAVAVVGDGYDGVGFMFTRNDPYCGVDLDDCRDPDTGEFHVAALAIIDRLGSYAEVSPSDTGAKIIVKAEKPGKRNRTGKTPWGGDIEMYDERRYFAITGQSLNGPEVAEAQEALTEVYEEFFGSANESVPATPESGEKRKDSEVDIEDAEVLERAKDHRHFRQLWDGDTSRYGSGSEADLAFCAALARITDDREQVERLWRASNLWREKAERDDYRARTIDKAFQDVRPTFEALDEQNDAGNAKRIVAEHGHDLRFTAGLGWLAWDGTRWKPDNLGGAQRMAEHSARRLFHGVDRMQWHDDKARIAIKRFAKRCMNAGSIENALKVTSWQNEIRMPDESFDNMPGYLNVLNGTLDLATGDLADHDRNSLITRLAPTEYDPDARSDAWDAFIERILPDEELRRFVQRCAGYSLGGNPTEKVLMFAHGPRDTGKSTFLDSIEHVLGDYAQTADFSTFVIKQGGRSGSNDLARMRGVRFVKSLEVDEGEKMAAGVVKAITGGDTIAARFLYKEHFEFKMEGVLWLAANARPHVEASDDAMWRRILHVPFIESIPKDEQDPALGAKLRTPDARRAILAWLVEGHADYLDQRINPPAIVTEYTEEYRHEMNPLADFFDGWAEMDATYFEPWQAIKEHVQRWADDERRRVPADVDVKASLRAAGCRDDRKRIDGPQVRGWYGIRLVEP